MIRLGVRAHDYGRDTPERLFQRIHGDGFSSIQLALKKAVAGVERFSDITPALLNRVDAAAKKQRIHIAVLGSYIEPALTDDSLRRKGLAEFVGSIPMAARLGADCIGTETTKMALQPQATRKEAIGALFRSLESMMAAAEENRVTVAIEPVASHTVNTPECAASVLKTIASPYLKVIFDPVNLLTPENLSEQDDLWERFFQQLGDKIAAVHVKGARADAGGQLTGCGFSDSVVDYRFLFGELKKLPYDFCILREKIDPKNAGEDLRFLQDLIRGE